MERIVVEKIDKMPAYIDTKEKVKEDTMPSKVKKETDREVVCVNERDYHYQLSFVPLEDDDIVVTTEDLLVLY
jgi:hypothetical protein